MAGGKRPKEEAPVRGNGPVVRFVLTFLVGMLLFQVAFFQITDETGWFQTYMTWNTTWSGGFLRLVGYDAANNGTLLRLNGGGAVRVLRGCDGLQPMGFYLLAVLAFPAPWKRRLLGALAGLLLFPVLNVLRISNLAVLKRDYDEYFEVAHVTVWPAVFIFVALLLWMGWARWVLGAPAPPEGSGAADPDSA